MEVSVLSLRTKYKKRESLEFERNLTKLNRVEEDLDASKIKLDQKTGKLVVAIDGKTYTLKEDV